jgi:hypothetical protein
VSPAAERISATTKKCPARSRAKEELLVMELARAARACNSNIDPRPIFLAAVGYKLFTAGLIPSMADMPRVYRTLVQAREEGTIPWDGIVDETRRLERKPQWDDPEQFTRCVINSYRRDYWDQQSVRVEVWSEKGTITRCVINSYRRDYWDQQSVRVEVWSEKGTIRGVLQPVLDEYGVGSDIPSCH